MIQGISYHNGFFKLTLLLSKTKLIFLHLLPSKPSLLLALSYKYGSHLNLKLEQVLTLLHEKYFKITLVQQKNWKRRDSQQNIGPTTGIMYLWIYYWMWLIIPRKAWFRKTTTPWQRDVNWMHIRYSERFMYVQFTSCV